MLWKYGKKKLNLQRTAAPERARFRGRAEVVGFSFGLLSGCQTRTADESEKGGCGAHPFLAAIDLLNEGESCLLETLENGNPDRMQQKGVGTREMKKGAEVGLVLDSGCVIPKQLYTHYTWPLK